MMACSPAKGARSRVIVNSCKKGRADTMPTGNVKWYDADRGFGFVSNPDGEDVYVGASVLPQGVTDLVKGQRLEYDFAEAKKGPQALRVTVLDDGPAPRGDGRGDRGGRRGGARRSEGAGGQGGYGGGHRYTADQLHELVQDTITLLEGRVQPSLESGRRPDRKEGRQVAEILRTIARELE